jgi:hypothetical protein
MSVLPHRRLLDLPPRQLIVGYVILNTKAPFVNIFNRDYFCDKFYYLNITGKLYAAD